MATTTQGTHLTEMHRQDQVALKAAFLYEFTQLWPALSWSDIDGTFPAWVRSAKSLARIWRQRSARRSLAYSRQFREVERPSAGTGPVVTFVHDPDVSDIALPEQFRFDGLTALDIARGARLRRPEPAREVRIDWTSADRALERSLLVTGPSELKRRAGRGEIEPLAKPKALEVASASASRHMLNGGRDVLMAEVEADDEIIGYIRVTDSDPCAFCAMLASRGPVYKVKSFVESDVKRTSHPRYRDDFSRDEAKVHDNCVLPGTLVTGPNVEAAYRRPYQGEVVVIGVTGGEQLSITPNHPVLTDHGWVDAGLLREGDHVVRRFGADLASLQVPHEHEIPTPIEDVWGSYSVDGLVAMPVAPKDFHGDGVGTQGDVHVVAPYGQFPDVFGASIFEHRAERFMALAGTASVSSSLASDSGLSARLFGSPHSPNCSMRSGGVGTALFRRELILAGLSSLGSSADLDPGFGQPPANYVPRDSVLPGNGVLGHAGQVVRDDIAVTRRFDPGAVAWPLGSGARNHSTPLEGHAQRVRVHSDLGRALLERLAGGVQLARVRELRRIDYSGHVLNLRTSEGWYDANGIIVSNCACTLEPVYGRSTAWPGRAREFEQLWRTSTKGYRGKDAINAFRRAHNANRREASGLLSA